MVVAVGTDLIEHSQTINRRENFLKLLFRPFIKLLEISRMIDNITSLLLCNRIPILHKEMLYSGLGGHILLHELIDFDEVQAQITLYLDLEPF